MYFNACPSVIILLNGFSDVSLHVSSTLSREGTIIVIKNMFVMCSSRKIQIVKCKINKLAQKLKLNSASESFPHMNKDRHKNTQAE